MAVTFLPGTLESVSVNLVNPYTGEILAINGDYYVNDTYVNGGTATDDILLSTTQNQFFSLEDELGNLLIEDFEQIIMNAGDDILNLASAIHVMGDMYIQMDDGNDIVWANAGNDTIVGGTGDDILHGGPGHDNIQGGSDNDTLTGAQGDDIIDGGSGYDIAIYYGSFADYLLTDLAGSITLQDLNGTDGTDTITTVEKLQFADGFYENGVFTPDDQMFIATAAAEAFLGGVGIDTVDYSLSTAGITAIMNGTGSGGFATGDTYDSIENVCGSLFADVIKGTAQNNFLEGMDGADKLYGNAGDDILDGGTGNDTLYGGNHHDTLLGGSGDDVLYGDVGSPFLKADYYSISIFGGAVVSTTPRLKVTGNDVLDGGDGNDTLYGEAGNDVLIGGSGTDTLTGGQGKDVFMFLENQTFDAIDTITDFNVNQDSIDISDLLVGYDPLTDSITDFVQITDNGRSSVISVDVDGGADNFIQIATLSYVNGLTDEQALEASGALITS